MRNYLLVLLVAAAVTYLVTAPVRRLAVRWGALTPVRDRDVHAVPTPRLGGLALLVGLAAGMLVASQLPLTRRVFEEPYPLALLSGAVLIVVLGVVDDRWGLDAVTKLAGQVLAAGVMVLQGIQLLYLPVAGTTTVLPPSTGVPLTILVVLVTINAVNFVDGLDGLAAGIVATAAGGLLVFSYILAVEQGATYAATATLVTALIVGVCLGFLPHNFFPARVFMGDSGSMLLGLLLAAAAISITGQVDPSIATNLGLGPTLLPLLLPVLVMLLPLADLLLAVIRRTRAGRSPFAPDKQHLHHRLLEIGHSHRRAVLILYAWSSLVALGVLAAAIIGGTWPVVALVAVVVVALAVTLRGGGRARAVTRSG